MSGLKASLQQLQDKARRDGWASIADAVTALLSRHPDHPNLLALRANAANAAGDLDAMIAALERLIALRPNIQFTRMLADAHNLRGSRSRTRGDAQAALDDFRRACAIEPAHGLAWFNAGLALVDLERPDEAAMQFERHLHLRPDDRIAAFWHALVRGERHVSEWLRQHPEGPPDHTVAAERLARHGMVETAAAALTQCGPDGDLDAADRALVTLHQRAACMAIDAAAPAVIAARRAANQPSLRAELVAALRLPAIHDSTSSLLAHRRRYEQGLEELENRWTDDYLRRAAPRLEDLAHSNFLLAYQGLHDRALQAEFGRLLERAVRANWPALAEMPGHAVPRRIGLLSSCWRHCTAGMYFSGWIDWLVEAGHEVVLYQLGPKRDAWTDRCAAWATRFRFLDGSLAEAATTIRDDELSLLIYPELGMDARLLPLAALRLAPHQAVAWGHPVTSGMPSIDTFVSCASMEPDDAATHYTEALLALPGLGVDYRRPDLPPPLPAESFGLDPARPRILVPQSLFKLHPDGDAVLVSIATHRADAQFVLFGAEVSEWNTLFRARVGGAFAQAGLDAERSIRWLPLGNRDRFLQVNQACDLVLDSLHWSGGNTSLDALCCGLPIVACPGDTMRSRQSTAMLTRLGLAADLVTTDAAAQAEQVVALLGDPDQRHGLATKIRDRRDTLFDAAPARRALLDWVERLDQGVR